MHVFLQLGPIPNALNAPLLPHARTLEVRGAWFQGSVPPDINRSGGQLGASVAQPPTWSPSWHPPLCWWPHHHLTPVSLGAPPCSDRIWVFGFSSLEPKHRPWGTSCLRATQSPRSVRRSGMCARMTPRTPSSTSPTSSSATPRYRSSPMPSGQTSQKATASHPPPTVTSLGLAPPAVPRDAWVGLPLLPVRRAHYDTCVGFGRSHSVNHPTSPPALDRALSKGCGLSHLPTTIRSTCNQCCIASLPCLVTDWLQARTRRYRPVH